MPFHIAHLRDTNSINIPVNFHAGNAFHPLPRDLSRFWHTIIVTNVAALSYVCEILSSVQTPHQELQSCISGNNAISPGIWYEVMPQISQGRCFAVCVPNCRFLTNLYILLATGKCMVGQ